MLIVIYLGKDSVWETVFRKVKYGWWSDNCLVKLPDLGFIVDLVSLQKKLSISSIIFGQRSRKCDVGVKAMILKYKKIP